MIEVWQISFFPSMEGFVKVFSPLPMPLHPHELLNRCPSVTPGIELTAPILLYSESPSTKSVTNPTMLKGSTREFPSKQGPQTQTPAETG